MKTRNIIPWLCLLLSALATAMPAGAQGSGENYLDIATKEEWQAFHNRIKDGEGGLNARLTADIDLGTDVVKSSAWGNPYWGTFDGQGHTITIDWNDESGYAVGLFPIVAGATIKNLHVKGKFVADLEYLGVMSCMARGTNTFSGCSIDVDITNSNNRAKTAGMVAEIMFDGQATFNDCLVAGNITAKSDYGREHIAGFVAWVPKGITCTFNNCLYTGTNNAAPGRYNFYNFAKRATLTNCYYPYSYGGENGTQVTAEQLKSGEVAYLLQNKRADMAWGQKIGEDLFPLPTAEAAKQVYEVKFSYNGEVKVMRYANKGGHVVPPTVQELLGADYAPNITYALSFEGGFSASSTVTGDTTVVANVVFKDISIATKDDWKKFCNLVSSGQNDVNVKMTADVDLGKEVSYVGYYSGTFDGQGHALTIDWNVEYGELAPFYKVNGATIKNLHTKGQITGTNQLSGLIVYVYGNTTISGCVSEVAIKGEGQLAGMIYDESPATDINVTLTDCAVKGDITATTDEGKENMGGFVYRCDGNFTFNNCLYIGTNNASGGYTFSDGANLTNCYYLNSCGTAQGTPTTAEQLKSGEVAKMLQGDRTDQCYWAQTLGETPSPYREADKAKANYVYYNKESNGWACDDFRLTDGKPLPIGIDFLAAKATYDRDFLAGKATVCLPYELPVSGFKAYTLTPMVSQGNSNAVRFGRVDDRLEAYHPYLLVADGTPQLSGNDIQVKAFDRNNLVARSLDDYVFIGTMDGVDNANAAVDKAYILQEDGKFHLVTTGYPTATVPAYHAYIRRREVHQEAKELSIILDGETTGIDGVTDGTTGADGPVYDLQGRRVADRLDDNARHRLPAGIYIAGGRKVILK